MLPLSSSVVCLLLKENTTQSGMPEAVSPLLQGALWCQGLVRCACHKASARALQGFVSCCEGVTAPEMVLLQL